MNKPSIIALLAVLNLVSVPIGQAEVSVRFVEPEKYTDLGLSGSSTDRIQRHVMGELSKFLVYLGDRTLPAGQKLEVDIYDIDMAGNYEPWRVPFLTSTRIVRDVYPAAHGSSLYLAQRSRFRGQRAAGEAIRSQLPDHRGLLPILVQRSAALRKSHVATLVQRELRSPRRG